jgi:hypothetical protein|tara:strand:- start:132 stop:806 length:675 start_codon:yes stop_codon:yes gene_type:complete
MLKVINIDKNILNELKKDFLEISSSNNKNFKNIESVIKSLSKNVNFKQNMFDASNMMTSLGFASFKISNKLQKILKTKLVNWTYPQVRIDGPFSKKFSTPAHKDAWVLDKNKTGYTFWFPLNEKGGSIYFAKNPNSINKKYKISNHSYWYQQIIGDINFQKLHIEYGKGLIFSKEEIHKSDYSNSRISVQFRFEELMDIKKFKRSVSQVFDSNVLSYWKKKINK